VASTDRTLRAAGSLDLPAWAAVSDRRRAHIERVTTLLDRWAGELSLDASEARDWHDAGRWHDALRDADEDELRRWARRPEAGLDGRADEMPLEMLHGPAAAARLASEGEPRAEVLEAIRWHTVGHADWGRVGRALFMADYLEPGRRFSPADRAFLTAHVATDFDAVLRQVVRQRLDWSLREGKALFPETVALWNALQ
jgi:HD superfamily phosphohydrolase YqeK